VNGQAGDEHRAILRESDRTPRLIDAGASPYEDCAAQLECRARPQHCNSFTCRALCEVLAEMHSSPT